MCYDVDGVAANRRNRFSCELSPEMKMKKLFVVGLDFQIWTGSTVLRKEDFVLGESGQLPPEDLVESLGCKKLLDTTKLNVFQAIKARARRLLDENGVRFMGGYAVPVDKQKEVLEALDKYVAEFNRERDIFLANYRSYVEQWIKGHPELGARLRADAKSLETVSKRLFADYGTMRMQPLEGDENRFNQKVESLSTTLFRDVAQMANKYYRESIFGKDKCRSWSPLLAIRNKLEGLAFLDGGIRPVIDMIDAVRRHLPKEGCQIEGPALIELAACVSVLSREDAMRGVANGTVSVEKMTAQIEAQKPQPALMTVPVPEQKPQPVTDRLEAVQTPSEPASVPDEKADDTTATGSLFETSEAEEIEALRRFMAGEEPAASAEPQPDAQASVAEASSIEPENVLPEAPTADSEELAPTASNGDADRQAEAAPTSSIDLDDVMSSGEASFEDGQYVSDDDGFEAGAYPVHEQVNPVEMPDLGEGLFI